MPVISSPYRSAGLLITRPAPRPPHCSPTLMPDRVLSASTCRAGFIPDTWCIEWSQDKREHRLEQARLFGLDDAKLAAVTEWVTPRLGDTIGWPRVLIDLDCARELVSTFLNHLPDITVLELALHRDQAETLRREIESQPDRGLTQTGRTGFVEALRRAHPPVEGGTMLGFEPLVFDNVTRDISCSWLCNGLEASVAAELGISPNIHGLIASHDDAVRCCEYAARPNSGSEPGIWLPFRIADLTSLLRTGSR